MAVERSERAIFIPASNGRDLIVPPQLSAKAMAHIYSGGKIANGEGNTFLISGLPSQFKENASKRFITPEIEVAKGSKDGLSALLKLWLGQTVRDGSLVETGFEINVMPTQGDVYLQMVREICKNLVDYGAAVDSRCGLHVHVDARDYDYMDIRKLVFLYELVEPALFACLPENRHNNKYCHPCGFRFASHLRAGEELDAQDVAADDKDKKKFDLRRPVHTMIYGKSGEVSRSTKYGSGEARETRYMGLNLYSYFYRGSVEFRHAAGTIDAEEIIKWSLICTALLDTAMKLSEKSVLALASKFLKKEIEKKTNLYVLGRSGQWPQVLKDSTSILTSIVPEQCLDYINTKQDLYKKKPVVEPKKKADSALFSGPSTTWAIFNSSSSSGGDNW